jgi:hypothetical protein
MDMSFEKVHWNKEVLPANLAESGVNLLEEIEKMERGIVDVIESIDFEMRVLTRETVILYLDESKNFQSEK